MLTLSKRKLKEQLDILNDYADIVSYSFKTNYEVGKILELESDCMFSVHTIQAAEKLIYKKKIWFFAQAWNSEELDRAFELGLVNFVVDNQNDLDVLLDYVTKKQKTQIIPSKQTILRFRFRFSLNLFNEFHLITTILSKYYITHYGKSQAVFCFLSFFFDRLLIY